jgi:hypothetical protein
MDNIGTKTSAIDKSTSGAEERRFDWPVCYEAEALLLEQIDAVLKRNSFARRLAERLRQETGTLLLDWTDHLVLPRQNEAAFRTAGFDHLRAEAPKNQVVLYHPEAMLPCVLMAGDSQVDALPTLAIRVENLLEFLTAHGLSAEPKGLPLSRFRRVRVSVENGAQLDAVERRGYDGYVCPHLELGAAEALLKARELWQTRQRHFEDDADGYRSAQVTLDRVMDLVGRDLACHVVFEGERNYWQRRNRAAQFQKQRQDSLGLGWANHDHHTFRSSRKHFLDLMAVLEKLGFQRRERFYAGAQAGWGAQILEQPVEGIVVFADVDLMPEEIEADFSRQALPPAPRLGTVGLWVGLHGESFLEAGMHHLEARFDFALAREQLNRNGIEGMVPFSDFEFLKQAFTQGERWPVLPERANGLYRDGLITKEQLDRFLHEGAIGSHLETLQRRGGFKGFNQDSVSAVIAATDPRKQPGRVDS